jgi:two-component system response regulator HydG
MGAYDYISNLGRPFKAEDLKNLLGRLAERQQLASENRLLREEVGTVQGFGSLIGASEAMQEVYRTILRVAGKRHPVLILGESGTGKELVARAIHAYSPWHDKPFVPIDCGALPPTLIESELFGHVRGAFTGADQTRQGLLAAAHRGTVLLDEIAELPVGLQAKLLRALQEREFKAIGSNTPTRLEARILAATNQDLEPAIQQGTFRKDLYYRLNVVAIKIPPLRERRGDIPALAQRFIDRYRGSDSPVQGISYDALTRLMAHGWPGNVRELENCIQHALAMGTGPEIEVADLPANLVKLAVAGNSTAGAFEAPVPSLQQLERRAILRALEETGGDRLRAAKLLGIGKTTIYRKLKEYGLENATETSPATQ